MSSTIRHSFQRDLADLQTEITRMGSYVVEMVDLGTQALIGRDLELAERVIDMDDVADQMDLDIEHACMRLLALQQPLSKDLRIIGTGLKVITDLERIGDFAVDIAKTGRRLVGEPWYDPPLNLNRMSEAAEWMVRESIRAYVEHDLALVRAVVLRDDEVDACYDQIFTELLQRMGSDSGYVAQGTWMSHVARFLERISDHAVNVVERVCYVETGELRQLSRLYHAGEDCC